MTTYRPGARHPYRCAILVLSQKHTAPMSMILIAKELETSGIPKEIYGTSTRAAPSARDVGVGNRALV